jgi:tetraacyldisaccharide 4'-kinase
MVSVVSGAVSFLWSFVNALVRCGVNALDYLQIKKKFKFNSTVLSVGNLEAGGTGKTPMILELLRIARHQNLKVLVLTRGYRGQKEHEVSFVAPHDRVSATDYGDEVALIRHFYPEVAIGVGKNRKATYALALKNNLLFDWILLDDGLQQFGFERDLDIIMMTGKKWGQGYWRECYRFFLKMTLGQKTLWVHVTSKHAQFLPPFELFMRKGSQFLQATFSDTVTDSVELRSRPWVVCTTFARGREWVQQCKDKGIKIEAEWILKDHESMSEFVIEQVKNSVKHKKCFLVLTGKDFVKWKESDLIGLDYRVIEPELKFYSLEDSKSTIALETVLKISSKRDGHL